MQVEVCDRICTCESTVSYVNESYSASLQFHMKNTDAGIQLIFVFMLD